MAKDDLGPGTGLAYRGDEKSWSIYQFYADDRNLLEVSVDNDDPDLKIYVGKTGATFTRVWGIDKQFAGDVGDLIVTKGRAVRSVHVDGQPVTADQVPDGLHTHIDGRSIQTYVYPRLLFLIAEVYAPRPPAPPAEDDGPAAG